MFMRVELVFDMIIFMLVKLVLMRLGVVISVVMFDMFCNSILLVILKVLSMLVFLFDMVSNWLFGMMMSVLIFFLSFWMFCLVWIEWW